MYPLWEGVGSLFPCVSPLCESCFFSWGWLIGVCVYWERGFCGLLFGGGSVDVSWGVGGRSVGLSPWKRLFYSHVGENLGLTPGRGHSRDLGESADNSEWPQPFPLLPRLSSTSFIPSALVQSLLFVSFLAVGACSLNRGLGKASSFPFASPSSQDPALSPRGCNPSIRTVLSLGVVWAAAFSFLLQWQWDCSVRPQSLTPTTQGVRC